VSPCPRISSSPITLLAARSGPQSDDADVAGEDLAGRELLVALARVPDPRKVRGVRHRLVTVLAAAVCAVLAGVRSYVAIAEWTRDLPGGVRLRLGMGRYALSESTIRRILQAVDAQALDTVVSGWLAHRVASSTASGQAGAVIKPSGARSSSPRAVAVDGKAARPARRDQRSARAPVRGLGPPQRGRVGPKQGRGKDQRDHRIRPIPLLDRLDLADVVITADALHTPHRQATYLHECGGHYVFIVKGSRPKLRAQLAGLPWRDIPAANTRGERDMAGGESRSSSSPRSATRPAPDHGPARSPRRPHRASPPSGNQRRHEQLARRNRLRGHRLGLGLNFVPTISPRSSATAGRWRIACPGSAT
jgi:hypothetical protein